MLFSEPKIPQSLGCAISFLLRRVSVLFSEPKIPQFTFTGVASLCQRRFSALQRAENSSIERLDNIHTNTACFSALQRAENSSIPANQRTHRSRQSFQCSSASRKFLNNAATTYEHTCSAVSVLFSEPKIPQFALFAQCFRQFPGFSALQRAENSSIYPDRLDLTLVRRFSALQRAENSSIVCQQFVYGHLWFVSVLFSEPKIPQWHSISSFLCNKKTVSVLFSEPKIPQSWIGDTVSARLTGFSALQRAENSSIWVISALFAGSGRCFSALQRAENSSIFCRRPHRSSIRLCFSALQRAENSSISPQLRWVVSWLGFQCSSASRKFLNL